MSKLKIVHEAPRFRPKFTNGTGLAVAEQGHVTLTQSETILLFSEGFANCLGVFIAPTDGKGGLLGHFFGNGAKEPAVYMSYHLETVRACLDLAKELKWSNVDLVLFRGGEDQKVKSDAVDLPKHIVAPEKVSITCHDLRTLAHKNGESILLWDPTQHTLHACETLATESADDYIASSAAYEKKKKVVAHGELHFKNANTKANIVPWERVA